MRSNQEKLKNHQFDLAILEFLFCFLIAKHEVIRILKMAFIFAKLLFDATDEFGKTCKSF